MAERGPGDPAEVQPVRLAPAILAPCHFVCVLIEVLAADPMVDAVLGAPQPAEPAFGLIDARTFLAHVFVRMVDAAHVIGRVQRIPARALIGVNDRPRRDMLADQRDSSALARHNERQRAAHALASDNHDLALAGLRFRRAPIDSLRLLVGRLYVAAGVHAVDFDFAGQLWLVRVVNLGAHRLAQLVRENKSRLVLAIEIAAQLKRRMPLGTVDEDRDGREVISDRQLARMKHGPGRDAELPAAILAPPNRPAGEGIDFDGAAAWAVRLAVVVRPADFDELRVRFRRGQPHDLSEGQAPCGCGEKEMLRHGRSMKIDDLEYNS